VRPPLYVPESVTTTKLMELFRKARAQFALIVDEYGELQGLVTIEDIVEEIIGEFTTQAPGGSGSYRREPDGSVMVDGMSPLRTLNRRLGTRFPLDGPKTLNGLIVGHLGEIPEAGTMFSIDGQRLEVVQVQDRAVKVVRLQPPIGKPASPLQTGDERASSTR
jgi:magnesium and cobalt exporter, CNNM family